MRNPWKITSFALAAVLAASLGRSMLVTDASADVQPKMREALNHLRAAESALQSASHDKGGHRVKAIELTRNAINQVEAGIKFDNKH
jgi:hypothetical protein